jgi:hypothetical protein
MAVGVTLGVAVGVGLETVADAVTVGVEVAVGIGLALGVAVAATDVGVAVATAPPSSSEPSQPARSRQDRRTVAETLVVRSGSLMVAPVAHWRGIEKWSAGTHSC